MDKEHSVGVRGCTTFKCKRGNRARELSSDSYFCADPGDTILCDKRSTHDLFIQAIDDINRSLHNLHRKQDDGMFKGLLDFLNSDLVSPRRSGLSNTIPTAALISGVNMPDHQHIYSHLVELVRNNLSPYVSVLRADECATLNVAMVKMISGLISMDEEQTFDLDEEDGENCAPKKTSRMQCNMMNLRRWYSERGDDRPIIILIQHTERHKVKVLQDLIMILSHHTSHLPIILLLDLATSLHTLHQMIPNHVSMLMDIYKFEAQLAADYFDDVLQELIYSSKIPVHLGYQVLEALREHFIYFDFSVRNFVERFKVCVQEHYERNPVAVLCCEASSIDTATNQLTSDQLRYIRDLDSVQRYKYFCGEKEWKGTFVNEGKFKERINQQLKDIASYHQCFFTVLHCLHHANAAAGKPIGKRLREIYLLLLNDKKQLVKSYGDMLNKLWCLGRDEVVDVVGKIIHTLQECGSAVHVRFLPILKRLRAIEKQLGATEEKLYQLSSDDVEDGLESVPSNGKLTLFDLQHRLMKGVSARRRKPLSLFEKLRSEVFGFLDKELFAVYLFHPEQVMLREVFYFEDHEFVRKQLLVDISKSYGTAFKYPNKYLAMPQSKTQEELMPDLCVAFKIYTEQPKSINLHDWMAAFITLVHKPTRKHSDKRDLLLSGRFMQALQELHHLGYIKPTMRRMDHVLKLQW